MSQESRREPRSLMTLGSSLPTRKAGRLLHPGIVAHPHWPCAAESTGYAANHFANSAHPAAKDAAEGGPDAAANGSRGSHEIVRHTAQRSERVEEPTYHATNTPAAAPATEEPTDRTTNATTASAEHSTDRSTNATATHTRPDAAQLLAQVHPAEHAA